MRYWLTAIVVAALVIAAGWFVLLNQSDVMVRLSPSLTIAAPLGAAVLVAFVGGAALVALLGAGGAVSRGWRARMARRRARLDARRHEAMARAHDLVWRGETSAARSELLRAREHPTTDVSKLALLAETHIQDGDAAAARELLERAPAPIAGDPRLLDLLAQAATDLGDRQAALAALERAYRARPGSPRLAARLRDLYAAAGRWSEAVTLQVEVLLRLRAPGALAAQREHLVGLRYEASLDDPEPLRAARQLRGLAREAPTFIPAWVSAGDRYAQAGRAVAARRTWMRGVRQRPAAILLDRIEAHDAAAGRPQRTTRLLRSLLRRHPDDAAVALRLARHLLVRGDLDEAATMLDGFAERPTPTADALRGELARTKGDAQAAADAFARALGPDLGLEEPWRCAGCGAIAARWAARCGACGRWDTLRARIEQGERSETSGTSGPLMRSAK